GHLVAPPGVRLVAHGDGDLAHPSVNGSRVPPVSSTQMALVWVYSCTASTPFSRPSPLSPYPPNGTSGPTTRYALIHTVPVRMACATRCPRWMSLVHTAPASPYRLSLASAIASSSMSNGITDKTGPNPSSQATGIVGLTPVSTVGWTKKPPSASSARPPAATVAPSVAAASRNESTLRYCGSVATGPISVSAARGSPRRMARARSAIL